VSLLEEATANKTPLVDVEYGPAAATNVTCVFRPKPNTHTMDSDEP